MTHELCASIQLGRHEISNAEHHADSAVGFSTLSLLGTPEKYTPAKYHERKPIEQSDAMTVGTVAHMLVYEPELAEDAFAVRPVKEDGSLHGTNTNIYKAWLADVAPGKIIVTPKIMEEATAIRETIAASEIYYKYATANQILMCEASFFWTDEETGIRCKIRPDCLRLSSSGRLINEDLKTCPDPAPWEFQWAIRDYQILRRLAWYRTGLRAITGEDSEQCIIAVGKQHRACAIYQANEINLDAAEHVNHEMLRRLADGAKPADWQREVQFI